MPRPNVNLAAGRRFLGARSHARLLDSQVEAMTRVQHADRMLNELLGWVKAQHDELKHAERELRSANERASTAIYEAPAEAVAEASMVAA